MSEQELITMWATARKHIILSQLGPIFLLTASVALLSGGLAGAGLATRLAFVGILLATGVLGAVAQYSAASEGAAVAQDLRALGPVSAAGRVIAGLGPWTAVVRFGTPAVFLVIFALLLIAIFTPTPMNVVVPY